jgi:hypothetical protein
MSRQKKILRAMSHYPKRFLFCLRDCRFSPEYFNLKATYSMRLVMESTLNRLMADDSCWEEHHARHKGSYPVYR